MYVLVGSWVQEPGGIRHMKACLYGEKLQSNGVTVETGD